MTPPDAPRLTELEVAEAALREAEEALERIDRLQKRWSAPLHADVNDRNAADSWAAVGSEAHKIAHFALKRVRTIAREGGNDDA